jgi:hypothetical protein
MRVSKRGDLLKYIVLKRLLLLAGMAAMVLGLAVPALAGGTNTGNAQNTIGQEASQEAESGEVDQSFESTSTGDNSNVCLAPSFVTNTGNSQNQIGLVQEDSAAGDFEFDEVSTDITVGGTNETTCEQGVNQAASASGGGGGY